MTPTSDEIARSASGALRIASRDPQALASFDVTMSGFWKSFYAYVLAAPLALIPQWLTDPGEPGGGAPLTALAAVYLLQMIAFPLATAGVASLLQLGKTYVRFVIVMNWATLISALLALPAALVALAGFEGPAQAMYLMLGLFLLWYRWTIARIAFETSPAQSVAVVVLLIAVDLAALELVRAIFAT